MLAFIASPLDLEEDNRLQVEREQEILLQATNTLAEHGQLTVDFEDEAKLPILVYSLEGNYTSRCQKLRFFKSLETGRE